MAQISYSDLAKMDLAEIWLYIAQDSPNQADKFVKYLEHKCLLLAEQPRVGREFPEFSKGLYGFPVKSYMIFYEISNEDIVIARVLNAKRDIPAFFE